MATRKRKPRIKGKRVQTVPLPPRTTKDDDGFTLKVIESCDQRFRTVKIMRQHLNGLLEDTAADTTAKKALCGRAAFLLMFLESVETDLLNREQVDWRTYLSALRQLTDVLNKLGLDKAVGKAKTLELYVADHAKRKKA